MRRKGETTGEIRPRLVGLAMDFVEAISQMSGVVRIALIGALTVEKANPKDVDLLVSVKNGADLAPIAAAARRMQGRAQSFAHGADVFLADPQGRYLGRTCNWKDCRPGVRIRCDALHCGRPAFLHADLDAVTLHADLIATPPVVLWPSPTADSAMPRDVHRFLSKLRPRQAGRTL